MLGGGAKQGAAGKENLKSDQHLSMHVKDCVGKKEK